MPGAPTPPPPRRPRMNATDRRAAILAAARAAFARSGYQGAGTAAIAAAAGCSEAILYRHFDSKRDLLLAVLDEEIAGRVREGRAIAPPDGADPATALPAALAARLDDGEMVVTIRLVLLALTMSDDPEVSAAIGSLFESVRAPLRRLLEEGQFDGRRARRHRSGTAHLALARPLPGGARPHLDRRRRRRPAGDRRRSRPGRAVGSAARLSEQSHCGQTAGRLLESPIPSRLRRMTVAGHNCVALPAVRPSRRDP